VPATTTTSARRNLHHPVACQQPALLAHTPRGRPPAANACTWCLPAHLTTSKASLWCLLVHVLDFPVRGPFLCTPGASNKRYAQQAADPLPRAGRSSGLPRRSTSRAPCPKCCALWTSGQRRPRSSAAASRRCRSTPVLLMHSYRPAPGTGCLHPTFCLKCMAKCTHLSTNLQYCHAAGISVIFCSACMHDICAALAGSHSCEPAPPCHAH